MKKTVAIGKLDTTVLHQAEGSVVSPALILLTTGADVNTVEKADSICQCYENNFDSMDTLKRF